MISMLAVDADLADDGADLGGADVQTDDQVAVVLLHPLLPRAGCVPSGRSRQRTANPFA